MATVTTHAQSGVYDSMVPTKVMHKVIDFAAAVTAGAAYKTTDKNVVFTLPVDAVVIEGGYEILTAATATSTLSLGTVTGSGTEILSTVAIDAVAGTKAAGSLANPLFCKDSAQIAVAVGTANPVVGKVHIWIIVQDVTKQYSTADV